MKRLLSTSMIISCFLIGTAHADNNSGSTNLSAGVDKAALEVALKACVSSVGKDSNGRPDMRAMEACMTKNGFSRPNGSPPGQGGDEMPPSQ
jgi:hypothetical protein